MNTLQIFSELMTQRLAWALIHFTWQGSVIAALLTFVLSVGRFASPTIRYALCLVGLVAMVACPAITFLAIPSMHSTNVSIPTSPIAATEWIRPSNIRLNETEILSESVSLRDNAIRPSIAADDVAIRGDFENRTQSLSDSTELQSDSRRATKYPASLKSRSYWLLAQPWIVRGWSIGVLILSMRLLLGWVGLSRLRYRIEPAPTWMIDRVSSLTKSFRLSPAEIHLSHRVTEAIAIGFIRPMILFPVTWATELPPDMVESVIVHELAHIRRGDLWVNLLQRIVETLLFYHPAVWWLSRRLRIERELCCDEQVVRLMQNPVRYAETLEQIGRLNLANSLRLMHPHASLSVSIASRQGILLKRIRAILNVPTRERLSFGFFAGILPLVLMLLVAGLLIGENSVPASDQSQPITSSEPAPDANVSVPRSLAVAENSNSPEEVDIGDAVPTEDYQFMNPVIAESSLANRSADPNDELILVIPKGQKQRVEFEQQILRVCNLSLHWKYFDLMDVGPDRMTIQGISTGVNIFILTDNSGNEFALPVEIIDSPSTGNMDLELPSRKITLRKNPLKPATLKPEGLSSVICKDRSQFLSSDENIVRIRIADSKIVDVCQFDPKNLQIFGVLEGKTVLTFETQGPFGLSGNAYKVEVEVVASKEMTREEVYELFDLRPKMAGELSINQSAEIQDPDFLVISKGQRRLLEFDYRIVRIDGFDPTFLNVKLKGNNKVEISGESVGMTYIIFADEKGTEFSTGIEVIDSTSISQSNIDSQPTKLKRRNSPIRSILNIDRENMKVDVRRGYARDLGFKSRLLRVDGHNAEVINVSPIGVNELRVRGISPGKTTFVATEDSGKKITIDVEVIELDSERTREHIRDLLASDGPRRSNPVSIDQPYFRQPQENLLVNGGSNDSGKAVEQSLKWLASVQESNGSWSASRHGGGAVDKDPQGQPRIEGGKYADTGVTGLVILSFLRAGFTHDRGPYSVELNKAINWLIAQQKPNGFLGGVSTKYDQNYCHAIATLALSEAYARQLEANKFPELWNAINSAAGFAVTMQNEDGGWRYGRGGESDMSMHGWHAAALKRAMSVGVEVPKSTQNGLVTFLKSRERGQYGGLAGYKRNDPATPSMTAESLYCRQMFSGKSDAPGTQEAVRYLLQNLPRLANHDEYYWYYGTLAMSRQGGDAWKEWNTTLRDLLISLQEKDGPLAGSWNPQGKWAGIGGRLYSTALSTMCLEVYHQDPPSPK